MQSGRQKGIKIKTTAVFALGLVVLGELLRLIIQSLPIALVDKIAVSLLYVIVGYVFIISNCIHQKRIINAYFMIVVLSIFFYYGQHILAIIDQHYLFTQQSYHILDGRISDKSIIHATFLAIESLLTMSAGFDFVKDDNYPEENDEYQLDESKMHSLRIASWILLAISIVPTIQYLVAQYSLTQVYGYLGRRNLETETNYYNILGVSTTTIYISGLFLPALYGLLISYRDHKHKGFIYALAVGYCVLYYLTGSRFMILKLLITFFLIQAIWIKPFTKKDIKTYLLIAFGMAIVFSLGNILRSLGNTSEATMRNAMSELSLGGMLWEPGIAFTTISNLIENCPSRVDFFYGKSVLGAILQCLPEFLRFGFFEENTLQVSATFSRLYYNTTLFGYGSSFVAEAYYNFGALIYVFMLIYGIILRKIDISLYRARANKSPYVFLIYSTLCGSLVFGVRNDLSSIPRDMLLTAVIVVAFAYLIWSLLRSKSNST